MTNFNLSLSGVGSIAKRLARLSDRLRADQMAFLGAILDLENEVDRLDAGPTPWANTVHVEEFADNQGFLKDSQIPESAWLETLSRETGLDCRAILDFKAPRELGLDVWRVVAIVSGKPVTYAIRVWIVPPTE